MKIIVLLGLICLPLLASTAHADSVLVGTGPNPFTGLDCPCGWLVASPGWSGLPADGYEVAVQFSLSGPVFVSTIDLSLESYPGDSMDLDLVNSLTAPTMDDEFTITGGAGYPFIGHSVTLNSDLAAGTYYLILSASSGAVEIDEWEGSDGTLIQNAGTVTNGQWISSDDGATWTLFNNSVGSCVQYPSCYVGIFAVNGTPGAATPEPSTLFLLGTGLLAMAAYCRRRNLAQI